MIEHYLCTDLKGSGILTFPSLSVTFPATVVRAG